jgi:tetratricopeptide (TPR) repeat protein
VLALVVLGGGGAAWWWWQRTETVNAVEASLADVRSALEKDRLPEARQALERAEGRLGDGGPPELRRRVEQARADVAMAHELDEIRLGQSALKDGHFDGASAGPKYTQTFQRYQLDVEALDAEEAVARIRASAIREQLLAALDNWSWAEDKEKAHRLRRIADGADDDAWRPRMRAVRTAAEARQLAARPEVWQQPPATVSRFARLLVDFRLHAEAVAGLRLAQQRHPGDFWVNHYLGMHLKSLRPSRAEEAVGFLRAAVALRPNSPGAHLNVGVALRDKQDVDGAIVCYRKALELDPNYAAAHNNLGYALEAKQDLDGAIACYRKALQLDPNLAMAHLNLGNALADKQDVDGAIVCFRRALDLDPNNAKAHNSLGNVWKAKQDMDGAIACYRKALKLDPNLVVAYSNLGLALQARKQLDEAIACHRKALDLDPNSAVVHNNLGIALAARGDVAGAITCYRKALQLDSNYALAYYNLGNALRRKGDVSGAIAYYRKAIHLNPNNALVYSNLGAALSAKGDEAGAIASYCQAIHLDPNYAGAHFNLAISLAAKGDVSGAIACYRKAIDLNANYAEAHYGLGLALTAQEDIDGAITSYRKAIHLDPNYAEAHCNLGHRLHDKGQLRAAQAALRRGHELGSRRPDWPYPSAQWVRQIDRLVALEEKLPAVLKGEAKADGAPELLDLATVCHLTRRYAGAVRFYADAFRAEPERADDLRAGHRYDAACYAALAGTGQGDDPPRDDEGRASLRARALGWLRADLTAWTKLLDGGDPQARATVRAKMQHWQTDADLRGIRHPWALLRLPAGERAAWRQLWGEVEALGRRAAGTN